MRIILLAATAVLLPLLASNALAQDSTAPVYVYAASKEHLVRPMLERFTEQTGIETRLTTVDGMALVSRLQLEGEHTQADAIIVADVANLHALTERGLLQGFDSRIVTENIPELLRADDNQWVGIATRSRLVFRRANDEAAAITDYRELSDPKWKDAILVRSSGSEYNQSLLADMVYRFGSEAAKAWAAGVTANMAQPPAGGDRDQLRALASGQGRLAIANSYYYGIMLGESDEADRAYAKKLVPIFPNQTGKGPHVNIRGAAITRHADNAEGAKQLIEFLTKPYAQRYMTENNYEYPANPSVEPAGLLQSWGSRPTPQVPLKEIGARNAEAVTIFSQVGWQ